MEFIKKHKFIVLSLIIVLLFIISMISIISPIIKTIDRNNGVSYFADWDGTQYYAIDLDNNIYIKDKVIVESSSPLPLVSDYFSYEDDTELSDDYTINYYNGKEEVDIDDFTYLLNNELYVKGSLDLDVVINNGDILTTKLSIQDTTPPEVTVKDLTIDEGTVLDPKNFVTSYKDNSQSNEYIVNVSGNNYLSIGTHDVNLEICDESNNCATETAKLTINEVKKTTSTKTTTTVKKSTNKSTSSSTQTNKNKTTSYNSSSKSSNSSGSSSNKSGNSSSSGSSSDSSGSSSTDDIAEDELTCKSGSVTKYKMIKNYLDYNSGTPSGSVTSSKLYTRTLLTTETIFGTVITKKGTFKVDTYENGATLVNTDTFSNFYYSIDASDYKATTSDLKSSAKEQVKKEQEDIQEIFTLTNDLRTSVGVKKFTYDDTLSQVAEIRAMEMALSGEYSHFRPDGSCRGGATVFTVYIEYASANTISGISENITIASGPTGAFSSWRSSSAHYNAMINSVYTKMGVGKYTIGDMTYWVQIFTKPRS